MRSDARKREKPVVTITAVEYAELLAEAWDKGYSTGSRDMHLAVQGAGSAASTPNPYRAT